MYIPSVWGVVGERFLNTIDFSQHGAELHVASGADRDLDFDQKWSFSDIKYTPQTPIAIAVPVCHPTSGPGECILLSKICSISHWKRKRNSEQNLRA